MNAAAVDAAAVAQSRQEQGLPPHISDAMVLDRCSIDAITVNSQSDDDSLLDEFLNYALMAAIENRLGEH